MQNGAIANSQISSSSYASSAKNARLGGGSYWNPKQRNPSEWFRVDLLSIVTFTAVKTQGSGSGSEYWAQLQIATGFSVDSMSYFKDEEQNKKVSVRHYAEYFLLDLMKFFTYHTRKTPWVFSRYLL